MSLVLLALLLLLDEWLAQRLPPLLALLLALLLAQALPLAQLYAHRLPRRRVCIARQHAAACLEREAQYFLVLLSEVLAAESATARLLCRSLAVFVPLQR